MKTPKFTAVGDLAKPDIRSCLWIEGPWNPCNLAQLHLYELNVDMYLQTNISV